jgi:hypothetical protein
MVTRATATRGYRGEGGRPVVPVTGPASVAPALVTLRGAVGILDAQARVDSHGGRQSRAGGLRHQGAGVRAVARGVDAADGRRLV